jgi:hypothetical protein
MLLVMVMLQLVTVTEYTFILLINFFGNRPVKRMWNLVENGLFQFSSFGFCIIEEGSSLLVLGLSLFRGYNIRVIEQLMVIHFIKQGFS